MPAFLSRQQVAHVRGGRISADGMQAAFRSTALPTWFLLVNIVYPPFRIQTLGIDARLYQQATSVWLAGGDPWALSNGGPPYAAAPWSLLAYLPTIWLPLELASWLWIVLGAIAAVWVIRRLDMAVWWLTFPPLVQALWNGNGQPIVLAALLVGGTWGVVAAGVLKIYGLVPALPRYREVAIAVVVLAVTAVILPWDLYVEHRFATDVVAGQTWNGSAFGLPILIPFVGGALLILRGCGARWLTIPALWPGTQTFYHVFAMPALRDHPWLAALVALPIPLLTPIAIIIYAAWHFRRSRHQQVASATIEREPVLSSRK